MLQVKSLVLYFFLLILEIEIFLNFFPDIIHKCDRFSKILSKKSLKFVLYKWGNPILLSLGFVLFSAEVDSVLEKQSRKRDALVAYGTGYIKIILALSTKVVTLYIKAFII